MIDEDDDFKIEDLNLEDLDVEQLEERLELAIASPFGAVDTDCTANTCTANNTCSEFCADCYNGCNGIENGGC